MLTGAPPCRGGVAASRPFPKICFVVFGMRTREALQLLPKLLPPRVEPGHHATASLVSTTCHSDGGFRSEPKVTSRPLFSATTL